jgi:hypothetical protein
MAITTVTINSDNRPIEDYRDSRLDRDLDLDTLKMRLALEGFTWKESTPHNWIDPMIRLTHPNLGTTWFRGWPTVLLHCDGNWQSTYWPNFEL